MPKSMSFGSGLSSLMMSRTLEGLRSRWMKEQIEAVPVPLENPVRGPKLASERAREVQSGPATIASQDVAMGRWAGSPYSSCSSTRCSLIDLDSPSKTSSFASSSPARAGLQDPAGTIRWPPARVGCLFGHYGEAGAYACLVLVPIGMKR